MPIRIIDGCGVQVVDGTVRCCVCGHECVIPGLPPGTTDAYGYINAYTACPDCVPATVKLSVTGLVPPANPMVPFYTYASLGGGAVSAAIGWVKVISGLPTALEVCLNTTVPPDESPDALRNIMGWSRYGVPLDTPIVYEVYIDPFPPIDEDGCYVIDESRAVLVCTQTAYHFNAGFNLIPGGVGSSFPTGHDIAGFYMWPCVDVTENEEACTQTFEDPDHPGDPDYVKTVSPWGWWFAIGSILRNKINRFPDYVNEVFDFCTGTPLTFTGMSEAEAEAEAEGSLPEGSCASSIALLKNGITWEGTVTVTPCCELGETEQCNGDAVGSDTWYKGRFCRDGELSGIIALENWVDLDSGKAYLDAWTTECMTFAAADSLVVDRGSFPWALGYQPFYTPLGVSDSCSLCQGIPPCLTDNDTCSESYAFVFTPGGACIGVLTPRSGTLTPQSDGTWKYNAVWGGVTMFCMSADPPDDPFFYVLLTDTSTSPATTIFWRIERDEDGCPVAPSVGTYDPGSTSPACDASASAMSIL